MMCAYFQGFVNLFLAGIKSISLGQSAVVFILSKINGAEMDIINKRQNSMLTVAYARGVFSYKLRCSLKIG